MDALAQTRSNRIAVAALSACGIGLAACSTTPTAPLPTVESVDLERFAGDWYEIARLPNRFQSACVSDTVARYRVVGDDVSVRNRCRRADGSVDSIEGSAKIVPGSAGAKLEVTFFWPFRGDYWILALDPSYRIALIGEPRRRYAWVLSRSRVIDRQTLDALLERAQALGFDRAAFVPTPQRQTIQDASPDTTPATR
ncbi:MAG: lipocalin family protein [Burkholderiaceae bacterium]